MADKNIADQIKNSLTFIRKLHFEISYLIKEIEGMLIEEEERFTILKASGYSVIARTSNSLDSWGPNYWMPNDFSVFFSEESFIENDKGVTVTKVNKDLKILFVHIKVIDQDLNEPKIYFGYINNIGSKKSDDIKIEHMLGIFTYQSKTKIFELDKKIDFSDGRWHFKGEYLKRDLLSINSSNDVKSKIVDPLLKLYRSYK
jgi:hypothetical protein